MFQSMSEFLPSLEHSRMLVYWLAALAAFLESLVGVGLIVPGTVFVMACGFAAVRGYVDVGDLIWFAIIGAIMGDGLSFYLGKKGTRLFKPENRFLTTALLDRGITYFNRHGGKSVFMGRFIGPLRALIPFVVGTCHMSTGTFLFWNVLSAVGWAIVYVLLGYFFGHAWESLLLWSSRIGAFLAATMAVLLGIYLLMWFLQRKGKAIWPPVRSVAASLWAGLVGNSEVQTLVKKHPRLFIFIRNRLCIDRFSGLSLSLLLVIFVYALGLLLGVVEDIITSDPLVAADQRIANLLYVFRNPSLVRVFLWVTALGKWQIIASGTATVSILLFLHKRSEYILPFWFALMGNGLMVVLGKLAFHRARPAHTVYSESSYAFPSGHAAMSMIFYGFLAFVLIRQTKDWRRKRDIVFIAVVLIMAIGLSRLYLGVHFLSDVWSGYLLGSLWLITAIIVAEQSRARGLRHRVRAYTGPVFRLAAAGLVVLQLAFCVFFATNYSPPRHNIGTQTSGPPVIADTPAALFADPNAPKYSETLTGRNQEPISLVIATANDACLIEAFRKAGWCLADPVTLKSILKVASAALGNTLYLRGPISPSFWNAEVNSLGFEKPTARNSIRERHHTRFWRTPFVTRLGDRIYVGTASLDTGMKWVVTHTISPDIDSERELIYRDFRQVGLIESSQKFQLVGPTLGHNASGEPFFTDGKSYWIDLGNMDGSTTFQPSRSNPP